MNFKIKITALLLALLLLFNSLYVALTYTYYYVDQSDFIAQFCVNKDKPELNCNGKCHLKKVTKESNSTENPYSNIQLLKELLFVINNPSQVELMVVKNNWSTVKVEYTNLYKYLLLYQFYHPPKVEITSLC